MFFLKDTEGEEMKYSVLFIIGIAALGLCAFEARSLYYGLRTSEAYNVHVDPLLTDAMAAEVISFVNDFPGALPVELAQRLTEKFPIINDLTVERDNPDNLVLTLKAGLPLLRLGDNFVMTVDGLVVPSAIIKEDALRYIPALEMSMAEDLSKNMSACLKKYLMQLPQSLFNEFRIVVEHEHAIWLYDKQDDHFAIMTNCQYVPTNYIVELCLQLKRQKLEDLLAAKKKIGTKKIC